MTPIPAEGTAQGPWRASRPPAGPPGMGQPAGMPGPSGPVQPPGIVPRLARPPGPAGPGPRSAVPRLVVPAYFHPAVRPDDWEQLARQAAQIRLVVLNPASGPGDQPNSDYVSALQPLHDAGVAVAGYVDTNYGQRPRREAMTDIGRYLDWYGITGVMFDRVSAGLAELRHYAMVARRARKMGAQVVAFNHGVHPHEAYARHADVLGTFEGPWSVYLGQTVPRWTRSWPADRFYHVVYSVPPEHFGNAFLVAARRRAGCVYVTDRSGSNPYDRLPAVVPAPAAPLWMPQ